MATKVTSMESEIKGLKKQISKVGSSDKNENISSKDAISEIKSSIKNSIEAQSQMIGDQIAKAVKTLQASTQDLMEATKGNGVFNNENKREYPKGQGQSGRTELELATASKMNDIINLCNENKGTNNAMYINSIQGSNSTSSSLVAASERKYFYVDNLAPDTTDKQVKEHLEEKQIAVITCDKIQSRDPLKSSFKIAVSPQFEQNIMMSDLWPMNVKIRPFIWKGKNNAYYNRNFMKRRRHQWKH